MNDTERLEAIREMIAEWKRLNAEYPPENRKQQQKREGEENIISRLEDLLK